VAISGGVITGITATGGAGFNAVKPMQGHRVIIRDVGGGTGAVAWAYNSAAGGRGTAYYPAANGWSVTIEHGGSGYSSATTAEIQGAFTFGGIFAADAQDNTQGNNGYGLGYGIGPGGAHYNFSGKGYCEVRFGDQLDGDTMTVLTVDDPNWSSTGAGVAGTGATPWVGGIAYAFLQIGYDSAEFPSEPEIRFTIQGKNDIYDPRTNSRGYSTNWALQVADVITDKNWGLGDPSVNQAQLIASANVCDEQIETSQGMEANYAQHIHYDTSTAPGDALGLMMPSAGGKLSRIGGEWYIWPAYWHGASFSLDQSDLIDDLQWSPYRSFRDLINRVRGTYIAPNYPYNAASSGTPGGSNLYDSNSWYYGQIENRWPLNWQPTNYPQYACDTLHGYIDDVYMTEDNGIQLPKELTLRGVISIVQAQRLAKIELMRNRQQGSGLMKMGLGAWRMQPLDVMQFSFPSSPSGGGNLFGGDYLEIDKIQLTAEPTRGANGEDGAMALVCSVSVQATSPAVYEWSTSEELTPYCKPAF
jgi:hypothetical protein